MYHVLVMGHVLAYADPCLQYHGGCALVGGQPHVPEPAANDAGCFARVGHLQVLYLALHLGVLAMY